jgi:uncharacterized protein YutE (UPF0331/DUF86 family)
MDVAALKARTQAVLANCEAEPSLALLSEVQQATLTLMSTMYGANSSQETVWRALLDRIGAKDYVGSTLHLRRSVSATRGALQTMVQEVDAGFVGSLRATITAEVLSDLVTLARTVMSESGSSGKDVAAVLTAAAFEDTIRRLAAKEGIPHSEKLADALEELKRRGVLRGAEVGVAQSYLGFRNKALHAEWAEVDMASVQSALAFTEQLLLKHFA